MNHEEHNIQKQVVEYLRLNKVEVYAIPNGGRRDVITATILKREGVRRGAPDLFIVGKTKIYFIEMKTTKGKQSPYQKEFEELTKKTSSCCYQVWRSINDAIDFYKSFKNDLNI